MLQDLRLLQWTGAGTAWREWLLRLRIQLPPQHIARVELRLARLSSKCSSPGTCCHSDGSNSQSIDCSPPFLYRTSQMATPFDRRNERGWLQYARQFLSGRSHHRL